MNIYRKTEKGQAIVLFALAVVGLVAVTALAIDTSNVYSERRHAQTAADNAALAGALALTNPPDDVELAATTITDKNKYGDDPTEEVTVINGGPFVDCKGSSLNPIDPSDPKDTLANYVEVMIRSGVDTFFGPVVGIKRLDSCVYSIARGSPQRWESFATGQGIIATDCHAKRAIDLSGASRVEVIGGGLYSNSDHGESLYVNDQDNLLIPRPPLSAIGGINADGLPGTHPTDQWSCPLPAEMLPPSPPESLCDFFYEDFPPDDDDAHVTFIVDTEGRNVAHIQSGIYCISDVMGNPDMEGTDVTFVLLNKGLSWSSNTAYIRLTAPTDKTKPLNNILIYVPYGNTSTLKFNGTAEMDVVGTIFAPDAELELEGDFTGSSLIGQWIGRTVHMTGSLVGAFQYDDATLHWYVIPPKVELTR